MKKTMKSVRTGGTPRGTKRAVIGFITAVVLAATMSAPALADDAATSSSAPEAQVQAVPTSPSSDPASASTDTATPAPTTEASTAPVAESPAPAPAPAPVPRMLLAPQALAAAATGTLSVNVTILDPNGQPVSVVDARTMQFYTVNVAYSCSSADCQNVTIVESPLQKDSFYNTYLKETLEPTYVPPFTGAPTPTGSNALGHTLKLGTVAVGTGGSFQLRYDVQRRTPITGGSFFTNGSPIDPKFTISADNAPSATGTAHATWYSEVPATVDFAFSVPGNVATGTPVTVTVNSNSGCVGPNNGGTTTHGYQYITCAQSWTSVVKLPTNAQYVAGSGGVFNAASNTVTLTDTGVTAARGPFGSGAKAQFQVIFPTTAYPTSGPGCVATETFTGQSLTTTYLEGTVLTATATPTQSTNVGNCDPFADASASKDFGPADSNNTSGRVAYIPQAGGTTKTNEAWLVTVVNQSNVPATVHIVDSAINDPNLPVDRLAGTGVGFPIAVSYTLEDGTTGTGTLVNAASVITAPAGHRFASVDATSNLPRSVNNTPEETNSQTQVKLAGYTSISAGLTPSVRTNTANVTVSYPNTSLTPQQFTPKQTVTTTLAPLNVGFNASSLTFNNGGTVPVVGSTVPWTMAGTLTGLPVGNNIRPQYVFLAPLGWDISSAAFSGTNPGATIGSPTTVTYNGGSYRAIVVNWQNPTGASGTLTLPSLVVNTTPTASAVAGTNNQTGSFFLGDVNNSIVTTYAGGKVLDATDIDSDGSVDDAYSARTLANSLGGSAGINVVKEICQPDASQAGGCKWVSDPNVLVPVAPNTTNIQYRVTVQNTGNTSLSGIVGYDILPYPGDTGTSTGTGAISRGSTFTEKLNQIVSTNGVTLQFSNSTNPVRTEVSGSGTVNDWSGTASGAQAIKLTVASLATNQSASFVYSASVVGSPGAGQVACNSVAVKATTSAVVEPRNVCAAVQSADVSAGPSVTETAQVGRPITVPFTFSNVGTSTPATVAVDIPTGVTVNAFPSGWNCSQPASAPFAGPDQLVCSVALLADATTTQMNLRVTPTAGGQRALKAAVTSGIFDPNQNNNAQVITLDTAAAQSGIVVSKSDGVSAAVVGQQLTYDITVTNPLTVEALSSVTVTDTLPAGVQFVSATDGGTANAGKVNWVIPTLAAGAVATVHVVAQVTAAAANISTNTVTAQADDPAFPGQTITGGATDTDAVDRLGFTKTGTLTAGGAPHAGDDVTFTFSATNSGGGTLTNVAIADAMSGLSTLSFTWPGAPGVLTPGQKATATAHYVLTQADVDAGTLGNTATATAASAGGGTLSVDATATVPLPRSATVTFDKTVSTPTSIAGETLTYTFTVTNTGNVTLFGASIADPMPGLSAIPALPASLAPGATASVQATYQVAQADIQTGTLTNTARLTATAPTGPVTATDSATATFGQNPSLLLEKTGALDDPANIVVGAPITFQFQVTNTGNVTVNALKITDGLTGLSAITGLPASLAPGQSATATATYAVTAADIDNGGVPNTATVTGTAVGGNPSSTDTVNVALRNDPAIALVKTGALNVPGTPHAGDGVTFTFQLQNTGNSTLNGITVDDTMPGLSALTALPAALAAGETATATATYALTQADIDRGFIVNSATARGTATTGVVASSVDTAQVNLPASAAVVFDKSSTFDGTGSPKAGDTVQYQFSVQNSGNVTLDQVAISDALPGLSAISYNAWPNPANPNQLAPGASVTATASYTLTQADIDAGSLTNDATVNATGVRGGPLTAKDAVTIALDAAPDIQLTKSADLAGGSTPHAGDSLTYTFTVKNTGNITESGATINDAMAGLSAISYGTWPEGTVGDLAPGDQVTATATYTLTQDDIDAGSLVNDATVAATAARGGSVSDAASVTTNLPAAPAATFTKTGALQDAVRPIAGQQATFTFTVKNTGNVTENNVEITDQLQGLSTIAYDVWPAQTGVLAPGETVTGTATYVLTQADVDAGKLANTATVSLEPVRGATFTVDASTVVDIARLPQLSLVKTAHLADTNNDGTAEPGETIGYSFEVANTGNVTVTAITIADPLVAVPHSVKALAPGVSETVQSDPYTVTPVDAQSGKVVNTATARGDIGGDPVESDASTATVIAKAIPVTVPAPGSGSGLLSMTGSDIPALAWILGLLLLIGGAILIRIRRRRTTN